ncbi:MAG TPA: IS4 family transposase [Acidobacteriota bacterium]|nr:IS4 family transposase [Acidobacteriota bacterium]HNG95120.1 IS4 family transposase [Acidobacteriota bacterium]
MTSQILRTKYRRGDKDFVRQRLLTLPVVIILILKGHKMSFQNILNKVFEALGLVEKVPTASAYCQAREKLKPEVFVELNRQVVRDYMELSRQDGTLKLWNGYRLLGVDGTYLNLPDTEETRAEYSVQTNQFAGSDQVQALMSVMYDLLNEVGISAGLGKRQGENNFLIQPHLSETEWLDLLVLDRGYANYLTMALIYKYQRDFVIRFPSKSLREVNAFWTASDTDRVVTVVCPPKAVAEVRELGLPETITFRLVKVELPDGKLEVLATSLLDAVTFPPPALKQVYGWRWNEETYFDRIKNIFEIERLSSTKLQAIQQDVYGVLFLATLEGILVQPAQATLSATSQDRNTRLQPKVNRAVSYVALVDHVVILLADPRSTPAQTLVKLQHLFQTNPTRHREGRQFKRNKERRYPHKLKVEKYLKRIIS